MRRFATDLSAYNRAQAFFRKDDRTVPVSNALAAMAVNEAQLLFLFLKLSGAVKEPSVAKWRPGPNWTVPRATTEDIKRAAKEMIFR